MRSIDTPNWSIASSVIRCAATAVAAGSRTRRTSSRVEYVVVAVEVEDEPDRVQQHLGPQARDVGTVALAHVEHPDERERLDRLPQRIAGQAKALGEICLLRQAIARA